MRVPSLTAASMIYVLISLTTAAPVASGESVPRSGTTESTDIAVPQYEERRRRTPEQVMEDCMALWEPATHMTKVEWMRVCKRIGSGY